MKTKEVGVQLVFSSPIDLTGATITSIVVDPNGNRSVINLTVGTTQINYPPGFWAYYNTTGTDFVTPGVYQLEIDALYGGGTLRKSATLQFQVNPSL